MPAGSVIAANHVALGIHAFHQGELDAAAAHFRDAVKVDPRHPAAHTNLGNIYRAMGRPGPAEASYRRAIKAEPRYPLAHLNLGSLLLQRGEAKRAAASLRQCLALDPALPDAHYNLALTQVLLGDPAAAEASYRNALERLPDHVGALNNLAALCHQRGELDQAEALYLRLVARAPTDADARANIATLLLARGDAAAAEPHLAAALAHAPAHVATLMGAATAAQARRDLAGAAALLRRAVESRPDHAGAWHQLGRVSAESGALAIAIDAYERALALTTSFGSALSGLVSTRRMACDWRSYDADRQRLLAAVAAEQDGIAPANLMFQTDDPADLQRTGRRHAQAIARGIVPLPPVPPLRRDRIRVGYLSGDFREHAVAFLTAGLFERHDRARFTVIGYSYGPDDGGPTRRRLAVAFDQLVEIGHLSHHAAASRIRADGINILVDLMGFTSLARPQVPAHRPAPVQVSLLGYPATMGAPFIDYIIADRQVAPMVEQPLFDEALALLPDSYFPTDYGTAPSPPTRQDCGLPDSGFVFACFNHAHKLTPDIFAVWLELLRSVPGSVLWLLGTNDLATANLRDAAITAGLTADRIIFAPLTTPASHLARLALADLVLDTLPYNAHTTATDALAMGVPVVTCAGTTFPGRVAKSVLLATDMPELITDGLGDYATLALALAQDPHRLAALRARLRAGRASAPLFDGVRYARHLEQAYVTMHERWLAGAPPASFAVTPLDQP